MSLPSPTLNVPSLTSDQISYNGLLLGAGTGFGLKKLEGLEKPDVRSGNTDRPRTRGQFIGLNLLKQRTITVTLDIGPPYGANVNLAGALAALRTATATEGQTEYPLWIQLPNFPLVCCMARVVKKNVPYDIAADFGGLVQNAVIQFECTDPYFYSAPTRNPTVGLPTPGTGFSFPLAFNLSFGGATTANQTTITNTGDVPCYPVLVITGPCLNPSVSNVSLAGNPTVSLDVQLSAGDTLVVDCDMQTIVYTPSGQSVGGAYPQVLQSGSTFFALPYGSSVIEFNSQDTSAVSGTLSVWNASAYDSVT